MSNDILIVILIFTALTFDFLNGFHDTANVVATIITSGVMKPYSAMIMAAFANMAGPFMFGVAVANTIGKGIVNPESITISVILAALGAAIFWNLLTWYYGIPCSSSHGLVGGLVGSVLIGYGPAFIRLDGILKVVLFLFLSPIAGFVMGIIFMKIIIGLIRGASPKINWFFKRSQILTSIALSLSHGTNDAQKTMGIITASLVILKFQSHFAVPIWVVAACAGAIGLGTAFGGRRIIKTMGGGIYRIRPVHGFVSQATSAGIILSSALLGGPVSTTQVVSSAIMGAGAAERISKVRWGLAMNILATWVITIPVSAIIAAILYLILHHFLGG